MKSIQSVGIVGAGTMGLGIAQVCATAGFKTLLYDVSPEQVARAIATIDSNLKLAVEKGKLPAEARSTALARVQPVSSLSDVKADLIIEAAVERLEVKKELFQALEKINQGAAILATNTSSISVTQLSEALTQPSDCIGLHFFNPADRMQLVEIIAGKATRTSHVESMKTFAAAIGKKAVLAKDSPGFIVNRVARHYYVESLKLLEEKAADAETIDALLRSAGFRMGPFELMDLIGVDTNLAVTTSVFEGFGRAHKFAPSRIQQQLVLKGHFGRKTGRGFYTYKRST